MVIAAWKAKKAKMSVEKYKKKKKSWKTSNGIASGDY